MPDSQLAWAVLAANMGAAVAVAAMLSTEEPLALTVLLALVAVACVAASWALSRVEISTRLDDAQRHWLEGANRPLAMIDYDFRILAVNERVGVLLKKDAAALVGADLSRFFPRNDIRQVAEQFGRLLSGIEAYVEADSNMMLADRSRLWLHWRATVARDTNGTFSHYALTFEDVSEKHAAQQAAMANLAELEQLNHLKSEFTRMVSHEFRTALTGIQGMSELMSTGGLEPAEMEDYAGQIFREAERANRLITDMLDLDRLEAGKMKLRIGAVDLNAIIYEVVKSHQAGHASHPIETHLNVTTPGVSADSDRLHQVLGNLVSNAIKYSPDGGEIVISTTAREGCVEVGVRDHGNGIPAELKDRLFGRFERYENTPTKVIGSGLGLAISRQIVEMHGGRIWVETPIGGGSEFRFTVPVAQSGAPLARSSAA